MIIKVNNKKSDEAHSISKRYTYYNDSLYFKSNNYFTMRLEITSRNYINVFRPIINSGKYKFIIYDY